jgi:type II secretion system protein I
MVSKLKNSQDGFTLMEVMIAVSIFAAFITAFVTAQTGNVGNSVQMNETVILLRLCENKINEAILDPPKFTNLTDKEVETKNFTTEGYKKYKYTIEYKKVEFPDFNDITGQSEEDTNRQGNDALVKKTLFKKLKENIEKIIWQVRVEVENTETLEKYELTSWVDNTNAQLDTNFGI